MNYGEIINICFVEKTKENENMNYKEWPSILVGNFKDLDNDPKLAG